MKQLGMLVVVAGALIGWAAWGDQTLKAGGRTSSRGSSTIRTSCRAWLSI